jgi:hypothetical protein
VPGFVRSDRLEPGLFHALFARALIVDAKNASVAVRPKTRSRPSRPVRVFWAMSCPRRRAGRRLRFRGNVFSCCVSMRLACESLGVAERSERVKTGRADRQARVNTLGRQLRRMCSLTEGSVWAAGRSLPGMSLAFALMAAINGSTGSCATLSHGL